MKMTEEQFKTLQNLDEHGQLHLVDEKVRVEYLTILRFLEIKAAGIQITYVKKANHDTICTLPIHGVRVETLLSGWPASDGLYDGKDESSGMGPTLSSFDRPRLDDRLDSSPRQAPVRLASARRSRDPFRNR